MPNVSHKLIPITKRGDSEQWVDARFLVKLLEDKMLLQQCKTTMHEGILYYSAGQLRRIAGLCPGSSFILKMGNLQKKGFAIKLPQGKQFKWYVKEQGIPELLCVKVNNIFTSAIVHLVQQHSLTLNPAL